MKIDATLFDKLAVLARLEFDADERSAILGDLNAMVAWVEQLDELLLDNGPPTRHALVLPMEALREDAAANTLAHEEALSLAPHGDANYFRVPSVQATQGHVSDTLSQ